MKVVLFCGGEGMRLREYSDTIPKPMVRIGYRPMLWYVMKYYAHFGHREFILCLGHQSDVIKEYFLNYSECLSNDFVLSDGGKNINLYNSDIHDWKITFADTGQHANIGQRLRAVEKYIGNDETFMANYSDGLTNLDLEDYLNFFNKYDKTGSFVSVRPNQTYHVVNVDDNNIVTGIEHVSKCVRINGGLFIFKREIFDYIKDGEDLVIKPFKRLIEKNELVSYKFDGFWKCMDTFKDKQSFDDMYARGDKPWLVWE